MALSLFLDGLIAVLLVATIGFCIVLNRRLGTSRKAQAELAGLAQVLNEATSHAQQGIEGLKHASVELGRELGDKISKAQSLNSDLAFMTEHGTDLADRLEGVVRKTTNARPNNGAVSGAARNDAELELLDALREVH